MDDPKGSAAQQAGGPSASTRDPVLRQRLERLQALRSAWGALAPSGLSSARQAIAEHGRGVAEGLSELLADEASGVDPTALAALDARLEGLERQMRQVAIELPVAQLRSTLPERLGFDRRGVLDLLDLLLGELEEGEDTRARLPTLDYVITLLSTGGDPDNPLQDPVNLTPRLHELCERSGAGDPALHDIETEFFAAADMDRADAREEVQLRTLRRRKTELGAAFFAPGVLRAIVTYNAALLRHIDGELLAAQDWGIPPSASTPVAGGSVFQSPALSKLVAALRRRCEGEPPAHDPVDRIAWCLDLAYLSEAERDALLADSSGSRQGLLGTTVLVGLLRRSAVVLADEFPTIGIDPEQLSGAWVQELEQAFQQEANRRIAGDDYNGACALSDLKGRFLGDERSGSGTRRGDVRRPPPRPATASASPASPDARPQSSRAQAAQLVGEAIESLRSPSAANSWRDVPWGSALRVAALAALVATAVALGVRATWVEGRVAQAELAQVSAFLTDGQRNGDGSGTGFVGTLDDAWSELGAAEQQQAAEELVRALRQRGVREVMVYDGERRLRIQALGSQPPRVVSAALAR